MPMADRDCGCWKPEKPEVVVTQELRERLSEAVKAEPAGRGQETETLNINDSSAAENSS